MAAGPDMTDKDWAAALDIHRQLRFPICDKVESAVTFALPVDIPALFDQAPMGGIGNPFHHLDVEILEECRLVQTLLEVILFRHRAKVASTP